jgi:DNA-binding SARP family transcriptional activator
MVRKEGALAKLSRPRLHDVLARTRLLSQLDKAAARPVIWLAAQPGAGKTTLAASWLATRKRPGIWYQVDEGDADPASFIYHLRLAADAAATGAASHPLPLLTPEYRKDLRGFARRFFRELFAHLEPGAALVLDNLQDVPESSAFHVLLAEAMGQVPEGHHVVVLSRGEPPAGYAALLAGDAIATLEAEALRLTLAETRAIARKRGIEDDTCVEALHARSHGWAAGLTLMLARAQRHACRLEDDDPESLQHVFGYFAQRVFDGAEPEQQRALMQLSFLPNFTADLAQRLTGLADAGRLLEHFYRRSLFTDRRRVAAAHPAEQAPAQSSHVYQFHALFRSFLQHRARATHDARQVRDIAARAGRLLHEAGHWEQALGLLAEAGDWDTYARVMVAHAEDLLAQGRHQTVTEWLGRMPAAQLDRDPWLRYWEGRALMPGATDRALAVLQFCHRRFAAEHDNAGALASGAAIVQTLWYARLSWSEIAPWIDRLEPLMNETLSFPSAGVELLTWSALHGARSYYRLAHPSEGGVGDRLLGLIDEAAIDWNLRLSTATQLITWFHVAAEPEMANRVIAKVDALLDTLPASAQTRAFWLAFRALHDARFARYEEAAALFQQAEDLARQESLAQAEFAALQFRCYLDIWFRRADDVQARVARMETHAARGNADAEMNFFVASAMLAQLKGDTRAAAGHAEDALHAIDRVGAAFFQAVYGVSLASVFADAGDFCRARRLIARAREIAQGTFLEAMQAQLLLEEAYVALAEGDTAAAESLLAQGLALAAADRSRAAYIHRIVARRPELLVQALRSGIEVRFVRQLIRCWRVAPPREEVAAWPWPVRVRTLGGFEVLVDDAPIEFGRKAPKKTLALLKAIIARGGAAPDTALIDIFWPDEEGDAATRSLGAAVFRLRTLLGVPDAVVQQGGQVSLDRELVWVDAWAFERALGGLRDVPSSDGGAAAAEALALYRGAFLAEEEGETWPIAMRERLRGKFIQAVADHAARLEAQGREQDALQWYQRGLDADDVVEPFYQGLMRCYRRLDRVPEAVSAYRRLKQLLSVTLRLSPSGGTERLYESLRAAA